MKHVFQTAFGPDKGNCFSACVAMITGIPLQEIPTFCEDQNPKWWEATVHWLLGRGWVGVLIARAAWESGNTCVFALHASGIPLIVSGSSPRFPDAQHAVVLHNGIIYDPIKGGRGIHEPYIDIIVLIPVSAYAEKQL